MILNCPQTHYDFWSCMDTLREKKELNLLWKNRVGAEFKEWSKEVPYDNAIQFHDVIHVVAICMYKEPFDVISRTIETLSSQTQNQILV